MGQGRGFKGPADAKSCHLIFCEVGVFRCATKKDDIRISGVHAIDSEIER